jgi:hypothetical protein
MQVRDIDYDHLETLYEVLGRILVKPEVSDSHNKNNAGYSILFEAISLIISFGNDAPEYLRDQGITPTILYFILLYLVYLNLPFIYSILFYHLELNATALEPYSFPCGYYNFITFPVNSIITLPIQVSRFSFCLVLPRHTLPCLALPHLSLPPAHSL